MHEFLDFCNCFDKVLDCLLIFSSLSDDFAIQVCNLIVPVIGVCKSFKIKLLKISYFLQYFFILNSLIELSLTLFLQYDGIEINPGPRDKYSKYFSFCHWNLNSLPAHNYTKVPLLQAYTNITFWKYIFYFRVRYNNSWLVFHDSSWSFYEPYFNRKHIFQESFSVNRTQDYCLKTYKQVPNY